MKKVLFAVLAVALMAAPASASVQNIKVSGDVDSTYLIRNDFDFKADSADASWGQSLFFTQTRLRVDADLTDNVGATVALINERVWGQNPETSDGTDIDLNLAYVTLREMLYSPLTVIAGRQSFAYGNSFVVDSGGTNRTADTGGLSSVAGDLTKRTAQDAIRLVFDYNPLTLDLLFSMIDENTTGGDDSNEDEDDVYLYGANANYMFGDEWETTGEAYLWVKQSRFASSALTSGDGESDKTIVPGFRVSTNPVKGLNLQGEFAWQFGNKTDPDGDGVAENKDHDAMGVQLIANYMLPFEATAQWSPVVTGVYTFVSGDKTPTGEDDDESWDPFFENQGTGTIFNALFDLSNAHIWQLTGQVNPIQDVTARATWTGIWLDEEVSGGSLTVTSPDGDSFSHTVETNEDELGHELSLELVYDYTEDVQFGLITGWFFPGDLFTTASDSTASQVLINGNVNF